MPGLTIPEPFRAGIAKLGDLSDASFHDFVEALKKSPPSQTAADLAEKIGDDAPSIPKDQRQEIISAIASMQGVQKTAHVDSSKFASDVWEAMTDVAPELIQGIEQETLTSRIATLLSETSIHLTSVKISQLRREVERVFCGARILTDVRTAFAEDVSKKPAMTILHTLELKYHDDAGRHREFYVALDDNDLMILKEAVERAEKKKATLVDLFTKADFEMFD